MVNGPECSENAEPRIAPQLSQSKPWFVYEAMELYPKDSHTYDVATLVTPMHKLSKIMHRVTLSAYHCHACEISTTRETV